ncbi:hypothetical protein ABPG72_009107 [Tetrahymena utriculariae]
MKKQSESSSQIQKEGKVKMGFVISNTPQNNSHTVVKKKERSMSPQSQNNQNTLNQVGQIECQQSVQAKVQKTEKQYISKLETQLKVQNKKKNDLVDSNHNLEYLLKLQDQKLQTYIEEIKQLRNYNEQLFKENKQLHLKVEGFAQERNNLLADNKLLKDTVKKLEIRLSLPVRPTQRKNILKTISDFSRENQYVDAALLQNEQTIQQYAQNFQQNKENDNFYQSRSNSPRMQENKFVEGNTNNFQREPLSIQQQRNLSNNSQTQQKAMVNALASSQSANNYNQSNIQIQGGSSSSFNSRSQLNVFPQSQQYVSQMNSNRSSQQFSQIQQNSAHFNNQTNNSNSLLQTANLKTDQNNQEQYLKKLQEQIKVLEDERETHQYEIKLLNQALAKDSSNEQMQKLIKDLVESKQRISQFTKNQKFLEEKIIQFEKLIDKYTHHNPYEMDRESLERKNTFLIQENQNQAETIQKLEEEIKLLKSSNNRSLQIQQLEADKLSGSNYNYLTTNSSGRDVKRQTKENQSPLSNRSLSGSLSQSPHHSSGTLQAGSKSEKLTLAASIKNQKINSKGKNALSNCCKDAKRLGSKTKTSDQYNINYKSSNRANYDIDETRRLLQVQKQKNQLLSKMLEEEQEKTSEYLVYKEEIDFYHQKNKQLQNDILILQSNLNQIQLSNLSIKMPILESQNQEINSPRQVSMSPRQQVKRICNTQQPIQGNLKRPQSPNKSVNLNYEPRSPSQLAKSNTLLTEGYSSDEEGIRKCRVPRIAAGINKGKINYNKKGGSNEEQNDQILAFMQIEKELNQELQKKEKQIENIINSRNLMQKTLGDQIIIIKNQNKQLNEQNRDLENQIIILNEEVKSLRVLVKRAEKKNLIGNDFIPNND